MSYRNSNRADLLPSDRMAVECGYVDQFPSVHFRRNDRSLDDLWLLPIVHFFQQFQDLVPSGIGYLQWPAIWTADFLPSAKVLWIPALEQPGSSGPFFVCCAMDQRNAGGDEFSVRLQCSRVEVCIFRVAFFSEVKPVAICSVCNAGSLACVRDWRPGCYALQEQGNARFILNQTGLAFLAACIAGPVLIALRRLSRFRLHLGLLYAAMPKPKVTLKNRIKELRPRIPATKPGDLWCLGNHRIMVGDCRDSHSIAKLFGTSNANLVFTSPPYASQRTYDESSGFKPILTADYVEWFSPIAKNIKSVIAPDGSYFLNIKPSVDGIDTDLYVFDLVIAHVRQWGFHFATEFCWERSGVPKSVTQRFKNQFEPIYQFAVDHWKMRPDAVRHISDNVPKAGGVGSSVSGMFGGAKKRRNGSSARMSGVQGQNVAPGEYIGQGLAYPGNRLPTFSGSHEALGHTAAFPTGLPEFFIKAYTDANDIVFDPFMGSGSTLIAAEKTQRIGMGIEISPGYCDVIVKRWQDFTGKKAILDGDGRTFEVIAAKRLKH